MFIDRNDRTAALRNPFKTFFAHGNGTSAPGMIRQKNT